MQTGFRAGCAVAGYVLLTASGFAQESGGSLAAPPDPAPAPPAGEPNFATSGRAVPVNPAPGGAIPAPATPNPAAPVQATPVPSQPVMPIPARSVDPVQPATPPKPLGATVSPMQSRSRVIESLRPERVPVFPDDPESAWWEINPRYAFARAQREMKPLLLLFTGTWNTQAMALSSEVFSTRSFNEYVKENLVICYLNYPRNFTDAPDSLRNLKEKFKVRGYPNVLVFNPNGEVEKGIRGYRSGRPVDYFNQLKNHCHPVLQSIEAQKEDLLKYGYRDWSNYLGKILFAKFVEHDGTRVKFQDISGKRWIVKLNDLAPEDQKMVESFSPVDKLKTEGEEAE